jgi:SAM-dependent methyltransferase
VTRHLDDGRHFLKTTEAKYDLVVYALVDSLILHSGYANLRLESYLFTEQAMRDVARVLKPGGVFVSYNYFRQGWIVERIAAMAEKAFGCPATVLSLPYRETVDASTTAGGFSMIIGGCDAALVAKLKESGPLWLNVVPPRNLEVDGFAVQPAALPEAEQAAWQKVAPSRLEPTPGLDLRVTDDWPFLYLRGRLIPDLSLRAMAVIGILGLAMVYLFVPGRRLRFDAPMFFLGAAFMLLETKAVVQLALLFGSTWIVNSAVFATVLVLILMANLAVIRFPAIPRLWAFAALFALIAANMLVPTDAFLDGGAVWRYVVPCALALGPMFFAGIVFALLFRETAAPDHAMGSNIAGAVIGGLAEAFSMVTGFRYLLLIAMGFYLLAAWASGGRRARLPL